MTDKTSATPLRTRVKICGLTREKDVHAAVSAGADALGFVFYPHSKRALSIEQAVQLRRCVPAFVSVVALFVNASDDDVNAVLDHVQPDILQFHGDESPEHCRRYGRRYIRAFRVGAAGMDSPERVLEAALAYPDAAAWLFDTHSSGYGGSGLSFDRRLLASVMSSSQARPVVLAGGLNDALIDQALRELHPFAVDVSSGVEASPGIKCEARIRTFMRAVRDADSLRS